MRHLKKGRKLNRNGAHREAMFKNMATSLLEHGQIQTTLAKAKELRGVVEKLITRARRGDLHSRRIAFRSIRNEDVLQKLFSDIAPRYKERSGGYTRVVKSGFRTGDDAPLAVIELIKDAAVPKSTAAAK